MLEVREILVKVLKKERKCAVFGKKKRNSSKNSYLFDFLWVEVACGARLTNNDGGHHPAESEACAAPPNPTWCVVL
jgi:hypothetical protein